MLTDGNTFRVNNQEVGIVFNERGCPIFDDVAVFDTIIPREVALSKVPQRDVFHKKAATEKLAEAIRKGEVSSSTFSPKQLAAIMDHSAIIPDLTWHHTEMTGRMQLIDFKIHQKTGHVGGMSIWIDK
jgi:filamentous hemagglutinin